MSEVETVRAYRCLENDCAELGFTITTDIIRKGMDLIQLSREHPSYADDNVLFRCHTISEAKAYLEGWSSGRWSLEIEE